MASIEELIEKLSSDVAALGARVDDRMARLDDRMSRMDDRMSRMDDNLKERMSRLERTVSAIESYPQPYGRPKTFLGATEYHSVSGAVRKNVG